MAKFDGILILSDLDGTLLNHGMLSPEQLEAVRYFTKNGGLFCPATGRAEKFLLTKLPDLPLNTYCIVKNGTAIYDPATGKKVWERPLDQAVFGRVRQLADAFESVSKLVFHVADQTIEIDREKLLHTDLRSAIPFPLYKVVFHVSDHRAHAMVEYCKNFKDYQYFCSTDYLCEIAALDTGKGVCADVLRKLLPDVKYIVGIGDYENDISLLKSADISVAVEGGYEPLKQYADHIAPPIEEHPVAWLIHFLEKEINAGKIL